MRRPRATVADGRNRCYLTLCPTSYLTLMRGIERDSAALGEFHHRESCATGNRSAHTKFEPGPKSKDTHSKGLKEQQMPPSGK